MIYGVLSPTGRRGAGSQLVAYDKKSGATIGVVPLQAAPLGTPMTYVIDGKQYVVLTLQGGQMVALAASSGTGPSAR